MFVSAPLVFGVIDGLFGGSGQGRVKIEGREYTPIESRLIGKVVMMALEADPARRYQSVDALGEDLRAALDGRAVRARPEGGVRQAMRLARRHRAPASALLAVTATLVVATTVSVRSALMAKESLRNAETSAAFLQDILGGLEPTLALLVSGDLLCGALLQPSQLGGHARPTRGPDAPRLAQQPDLVAVHLCHVALVLLEDVLDALCV
jgi:hypothetical protein